jgi:hypothetical protein
MKGPLQLIRRRRVERPANEVDSPPPATEAPTEAHRAPGSGPADPAAATTADATPAGQEPAPAHASFRHRGRLRRRLRYLRRVRELGFRDLGGLVFDQHKFARANDQLVAAKLAALAAVDAELRALEHALGDPRPITELREPGISACPRCGALHGSEAHFCPSCGVPLQGPRAMAGIGEAVSTTVGEIGPVAPASPPQIAAPADAPPAQAAPTPDAEPPTEVVGSERPPGANGGTGAAEPAAERTEP